MGDSSGSCRGGGGMQRSPAMCNQRHIAKGVMMGQTVTMIMRPSVAEGRGLEARGGVSRDDLEKVNKSCDCRTNNNKRMFVVQSHGREPHLWQ